MTTGDALVKCTEDILGFIAVAFFILLMLGFFDRRD
jgi:hypothetical protein